MVIEMFRKNRSKSNINAGSKESLEGYQTSSSENLVDSDDTVYGSSASLYRITQFELWYLGMIQDVNLGGVHDREPDILLIDKVEEAQLEGKIQLLPKEDDLRTVMVSKHGLRVMDRTKKKVLQRQPLHNVAQIVYYTDSFNKNNVALKIGQVGRTVYDCYVFQCYTETQAQNVCQSLRDVFDMISSHPT